MTPTFAGISGKRTPVGAAKHQKSQLGRIIRNIRRKIEANHNQFEHGFVVATGRTSGSPACQTTVTDSLIVGKPLFNTYQPAHNRGLPAHCGQAAEIWLLRQSTTTKLDTKPPDASLNGFARYRGGYCHLPRSRPSSRADPGSRRRDKVPHIRFAVDRTVSVFLWIMVWRLA